MSIEAMKQALELAKKLDRDLSVETWELAKVMGQLEQAIAEAEKQEQGEPVAWMYDWISDEGEFIQDWTTSMAETLRDTGKTVITNVRPLYLTPKVIHKPLQHLGEIPMAWCRWSEHLGKWMYTHRQPTEELAWIPLYDHPPQPRKPLTDEQKKSIARRAFKDICKDYPVQDRIILVINDIEAAHGIGVDK